MSVSKTYLVEYESMDGADQEATRNWSDIHGKFFESREDARQAIRRKCGYQGSWTENDKECWNASPDGGCGWYVIREVALDSFSNG